MMFVAVAGTVAGEQSDGLADEDLAALSGRLEPLGRHDRKTEAVVVLPTDVTRGDADADR